jgi:DNA-directed RNA polymerase specialized sigma24 family protein
MFLPMSRLAEFLRQERQALIGYVRRRIDDAADYEAEDIVQETVALREAAVAAGQDPALEIEKEEMLEDVFEAMEELSVEERAVVLATEMEGRTFKELAEDWDIPIGTLLARKSRALGKIRNQLTGQTNLKKGVTS